MATILKSFDDNPDYSSSSADVFSHYCENDSESYASKYLAAMTNSNGVSDRITTRDTEHVEISSSNGQTKTKSILFIGEPFSALVNSLIPSPHLLLNDTDEQTVYDEFGFRIDINENEQTYQIMPNTENDQAKLKWLTHLDATYKIDVVHLPLQEDQLVEKIDPKQLRQDPRIPQLLKQSFGIPSSLRGQIWMCLSGSLRKKQQAKLSYTEMLKQCNNDAQIYSKQIEKDLLRTLPTNACFMTMNASGISRLRRVLRTVAWLFPGKFILVLFWNNFGRDNIFLSIFIIYYRYRILSSKSMRH